VPNWSDPEARAILTEGLVITIEPIIASVAATSGLQTMAGPCAPATAAFSAHYEHTVVITRGQPFLITAA